MINNTQSSRNSKLYQPSDCKPILEIVKNPVNELSKLPINYLRVLNYINWYSNHYAVIFISQALIAQKLGICTRTVKRAIKVLREKGLINTNQRFNETLIYRVSSFFKKPWLRKKLQHILPALYWTSIMLIDCPDLYSYVNSNEVSLYNIKEIIYTMEVSIFHRLSTTMRLSPEQTRQLVSYPAHIVEYADQELRKKGSVVETWTRDYRNRYFMSICKRQFALKWRPYDPLPVDKVATLDTVVSQPSPSKATAGPVVASEIPTQQSPPPPVFKPEQKDSAKDIINYVSDNFGLESVMVTENGRTTKMVLSDKGIVPLASVTKKPKSTTEQRKVQWIDSVTAQVATKEEAGLAAFAQLMMATVPMIKETVKEEILRDMHKSKHATVEDLIADSIKPHIQVDGAVKNVVVDEDNYWFTGIGDTENYDFIP